MPIRIVAKIVSIEFQSTLNRKYHKTQIIVNVNYSNYEWQPFCTIKGVNLNIESNARSTVASLGKRCHKSSAYT